MVQPSWNMTLYLIKQQALNGQIFELRIRFSDHCIGRHVRSNNNNEGIHQAGY